LKNRFQKSLEKALTIAVDCDKINSEKGQLTDSSMGVRAKQKQDIEQQN
jgi:hypothetical protein